MITVLTIVHVIVSIFLILVVLLQQGKGQDFASTFGGGGTQAAFGARGSTTILHQLTTVAAVMFMVTSLVLTIMVSRPGSDSVIPEGATAPIDAPAPDDAPPAAPAPDGGAEPEEEEGGPEPDGN